MPLKLNIATTEISRRLEENRDLIFKRDRLYNKKDTLYTKYISRNDFSERDLTPLFDIYKKYLLERSYLSDNLLNKCLEDIVTIYISIERAIYYPSIAPKEGRYLVYNKSILE
ncbi:hypothetical protein N7524_001110 [Penicillium chrysogenum]|nr:hypothetical protein N7524_001110 [Penicillium chrysogenum]